MITKSKAEKCSTKKEGANLRLGTSSRLLWSQLALSLPVTLIGGPQVPPQNSTANSHRWRSRAIVCRLCR